MSAIKNPFLIGSIIGLAIGAVCFLSTLYMGDGKIVVVDSQKVLEEYQGFVEAQDHFESKIQELRNGFAENRKTYDRKAKEYEIMEGQLSFAEKSKKKEELERMQQELIKLGTTIENESAIEEERLLEGLFNKINEFINRYGDEKGYSVILGANGQGNVMYVKGTSDVTQAVIEELNKEYLHGVH